MLALLLKTPDLDALAQALAGRFGETPGLFEHEPLCVDLSALRESEAVPDFEALTALLRQYGFNPMAARGGNAEQMAAALAAGLAEAPDHAPARTPTPSTEPVAAEASGDAAAAPPAEGPAHEAGVVPEGAAASHAAPVDASPAPAASAEAPAAAAEPPAAPERAAPATLIIDKPLRSGQQVYARGADLIVLAVVSFGAEVIADGHIHVYAPLRGRALAGARGNTQARIFATSMEPQLVSIAGTYRTTEAGMPAGVAGQPAQVRLEGDKLIFEPLKL